VSVAITHRHGRFSYDRSKFRDCVVDSPGLTRSAAPLLVGGTHLGGADGLRMTVFGVLAAAGTRQVRVTVSDGLDDTHVSARLEPIALRASRATDLRFAAIALPGRHCVERLATKSALGKTLWQSTPGERDCDYSPTPPEGPPASSASSK
jgi:hypothetical protein